MAKETALEKESGDFRIRFSVRLRGLFFPIDGFRFLDMLKRAGYQPLIQIPPRPIAPHVSLDFAGPVAQKGVTIVDGNTDKGVLGVESQSYESAVLGFSELSSLLKENLGVVLDDQVRFFEITAQFNISSDKSPIEVIGRTFGGTNFVRAASRILEEETSVFSFRLTPKGRVPNQEEWFDITIEPDLIKSRDTYTVYVVYRSSERSKIDQFGKALEQRITSLVKEIER